MLSCKTISPISWWKMCCTWFFFFALQNLMHTTFWYKNLRELMKVRNINQIFYQIVWWKVTMKTWIILRLSYWWILMKNAVSEILWVLRYQTPNKYTLPEKYVHYLLLFSIWVRKRNSWRAFFHIPGKISWTRRYGYY